MCFIVAEWNLVQSPHFIKPFLVYFQGVAALLSSILPPEEAPDREEQIATLREKLLSPSTPEGSKSALQSAIDKITYRPRRKAEVAR